MSIEVDENSIIRANSQFWEQMLSMHLDPMSCVDEFCLGAGHVLGTVHLSGAWTGMVEIRMDGGMALRVTSEMLMQPTAEVQAADTLDATKEISNMIAGGIKSALPRPCAMTVPEAVITPQPYCHAMRAPHSIAVCFRSDMGEMMVIVSKNSQLESIA